MGLAEIVGLAVVFAFRDITENFIASVLLGVETVPDRRLRDGRWPERRGQVAEHAGNGAGHPRGRPRGDPNAMVFKEILINSTASPNFRNSFDVVIPNEASTVDAIAAVSGGIEASGRILPP